MKISDIKKLLLKGELDENLKMLTCSSDIKSVKERYIKLIDNAINEFNDLEDAYLISSPGRVEIGGNHTDHQKGRVLAGSVNIDIIAIVCKSKDSIEYKSDDFNLEIYIDDLEIKPEEKFTSNAIIRGIAYKFKELGYNIGGFKAYTHSEILIGSGISSSAAFEVLIGNIFNYLYNDGKIDSVTIAKIGQFAENNYFMKPSGLLDQVTCSIGGLITIDFKDEPLVEKIEFDFVNSGYVLCLVDTKKDHVNLSDEYALIPYEMKQVAKVFNKDFLSEITMDDLLNNIDKVKKLCSYRAILRSIHFLNETDRVVKQVKALKENDLETFKKLIVESGYSSYMYLQNVYKDNNQELALALAISEQLLKGRGAYRVHGGGFAGTIQALMPKDMLEKYMNQMEKIFGKDTCHILKIRPVGGYKIIGGNYD